MTEPKQLCRYCNSIDIKAYKKIGVNVVNYCKKCHLLFTDERVTDIPSLINKQWYSEGYILSYLNRVVDLKKRFNQRILEIELIKKGGSLLDLGCGVGVFIESMIETARFKWKLYGVDINKHLVSKAKSRLKGTRSNIYSGTLTSLRFKTNLFDCITCFDVLEHDNQLETTLKEIHKILKPSGLLLIQSPNYHSVMAYLCGALWDWWAIPDHIFHFDSRSLCSILKDQGFHIRNVYTWDPREEFIGNIQGSIKIRIGLNRKLGSLISKCLYIPLLLLWVVLSIVEKRLNIGSLLVILAEA